MGKRNTAPLDEVLKKIQEVRDFHELGRKAKKFPPSKTIADQAEILGCKAARLSVARRFAARYSEVELDELCDLVLKHRPVFGPSHVEILITIPKSKRSKFQSWCIKKNWSRRELIAAKTKRISPKSKGGRHPAVTPDNAVVEIEDHANAICRLVSRMRKPLNGKPSSMAGFDPGFRLCIEALEAEAKAVRKVARARLKITQQDE